MGSIFSPRNLTGPLRCCCCGGRCGCLSLHTVQAVCNCATQCNTVQAVCNCAAQCNTVQAVCKHDAPHKFPHTLCPGTFSSVCAPKKFSIRTFPLWPMHPRNALQYIEHSLQQTQTQRTMHRHTAELLEAFCITQMQSLHNPYFCTDFIRGKHILLQWGFVSYTAPNNNFSSSEDKVAFETNLSSTKFSSHTISKDAYEVQEKSSCNKHTDDGRRGGQPGKGHST